MKFFAMSAMVLFAFSASSQAALLSCESSLEGAESEDFFLGEIHATRNCSSGFKITLNKEDFCVLPSLSVPEVYTGSVRGCGYSNDYAFVITELLPLGAE